jgi:hypothetical protein
MVKKEIKRTKWHAASPVWPSDRRLSRKVSLTFKTMNPLERQARVILDQENKLLKQKSPKPEV